MDKKYQYTDIFILLPQLTKENFITEQDKKKIKEYILNKKPDLQEIMQTYGISKNKRKFSDDLKIACEIMPMNSPLGDGLVKRKRGIRKTKKTKETAGEIQVFAGVQVADCEFGQSPKISEKVCNVSSDSDEDDE